MDVTAPLALLGGLSPQHFMRAHWQKEPLLVRQAWPGVRPPLPRGQLFDLVGQPGVEARLLERGAGPWRLRHGPLARRALPELRRPDWTLLVQGLDLHVQAAHQMLQAFRFLPDARLDDLMISYASDRGGVGPHLDSYDVFLLQVHGRRRWRIGPVADRRLLPDLPVKILAHFEPAEEFVLEPGDMLYLPPLWGHDGIAEGECMTCSIGFRVSSADGLAREMLQRLGEDVHLRDGQRLYSDARQPATAEPGRVPTALRDFAARAVRRALHDGAALEQALGSLLSEPKAQVWFEGHDEDCLPKDASIWLDRRTRMLYDERHVFVNGEAFRAAGRDARLLAELADRRCLRATGVAKLSATARALLGDWWRAGWLHARNPDEEPK